MHDMTGNVDANDLYQAAGMKMIAHTQITAHQQGRTHGQRSRATAVRTTTRAGEERLAGQTTRNAPRERSAQRTCGERRHGQVAGTVQGPNSKANRVQKEIRGHEDGLTNAMSDDGRRGTGRTHRGRRVVMVCNVWQVQVQVGRLAAHKQITAHQQGHIHRQRSRVTAARTTTRAGGERLVGRTTRDAPHERSMQRTCGERRHGKTADTVQGPHSTANRVHKEIRGHEDGLTSIMRDDGRHGAGREHEGRQEVTV